MVAISKVIKITLVFVLEPYCCCSEGATVFFKYWIQTICLRQLPGAVILDSEIVFKKSLHMKKDSLHNEVLEAGIREFVALPLFDFHYTMAVDFSGS